MMSVGLKFVSEDVDVAMPVRMVLTASEANSRLVQDTKGFEKAGVIAACFYSRFEPDPLHEASAIRYGSTFTLQGCSYVAPCARGLS
jgi:hypothetical protein